MKNRLAFLALVALFLGSSHAARAQTEITLLVPGPLGRETVDKLVANFEKKTGDKVKVIYANGSKETPPYGTRQLVARGQAQDVSIIFAPYPQAVNSGHIDPKTATTIVRLVLGLSVQKGAPKPNISTPAAVKKTLLASKSIAIVDPAQGTLGGEAMDALKKMDLAEKLKPKLKSFPGSGEAEQAVAKGEVELFLGPQVSDKLQPGIDLVGGLPKAVATPVDAVGYLSTTAKDPAAAKALLAYLVSPEAQEAFRAAGLQPAHLALGQIKTAY